MVHRRRSPGWGREHVGYSTRKDPRGGCSSADTPDRGVRGRDGLPAGLPLADDLPVASSLCTLEGLPARVGLSGDPTEQPQLGLLHSNRDQAIAFSLDRRPVLCGYITGGSNLPSREGGGNPPHQTSRPPT